jgi:malonyl-CoA decarboxylase
MVIGRCAAAGKLGAKTFQLCHQFKTLQQLGNAQLGDESAALGLDHNQPGRFKRLQGFADRCSRTAIGGGNLFRIDSVSGPVVRLGLPCFASARSSYHSRNSVKCPCLSLLYTTKHDLRIAVTGGRVMGKQRLSFLTDFVEAITRRRRGGETETLHALARPALERLIAASSVLMKKTGEASRIAVAEQALLAYAGLNAEDRLRFFRHLRDDYGVNSDQIRSAYQVWDTNQDAAAVADLFRAVEPARQTLLRRLNMAPGATLQLVRMREDLLSAIRKDASLAPIDQDFAHLFASWFNRGFLTLRRIDWNTPAAILEKIMAYESVHQMAGWDDLKRRLADADRRLYAFFHAATGDEPLIFVEVALVEGMAEAIAPILQASESREIRGADTAVFYSINNSLPGLKGVSFGNFLIKQVVSVLSIEMPQIRSFVTLSPVPGFARWLSEQSSPRASALAKALAAEDWLTDPDQVTRLRPEIEAVAAQYIVKARNGQGLPVDPVARFHLGNGACAYQLNWPADLKPSALKAAHGLMINYLYEPDEIEARHEAFVREGHVAQGPQIVAALANAGKGGPDADHL